MYHLFIHICIGIKQLHQTLYPFPLRLHTPSFAYLLQGDHALLELASHFHHVDIAECRNLPENVASKVLAPLAEEAAYEWDARLLVGAHPFVHHTFHKVAEN